MRTGILYRRLTVPLLASAPEGDALTRRPSASSLSRLALAAAVACASALPARAQDAGERFPNMPSIAPIGEKIGKYLDVPAAAVGPAIDPAKGYRLQDLGGGLYMVTDNAYQSMFLVYDSGVVVIDAPPGYAAKIPLAIAEVTKAPITHVVYSHAHIDHIGGTKALGGRPTIIAHEETRACSRARRIRTGRCRP